jgi:hypothetical protein
MTQRRHRGPFLLLLLLLLASTTSAAPHKVTVTQLLANPHDFNGRRVSVTGYYYADIETSCLCSSTSAARHINAESSIWVEFRGTPDLTRMAGHYVRFVGTFHVRSQANTKQMRGYGSYGIWPAALLDTTSFTVLR